MRLMGTDGQSCGGEYQCTGGLKTPQVSTALGPWVTAFWTRMHLLLSGTLSAVRGQAA